MERPALFVGDAEEGEATLQEHQVRERMKQGLPADSAEEYLLRVRIESNDLPAVVEAHVPEGLKKKQTMYMPSTEPVPSCPAYLLPSEDWEREVLSTFVDLRQYLRRWKATAGVSPAERSPVPALKDNTGWHIFCLGYSEDGTQEEDSELGSTGGPALSEVHHTASSAAVLRGATAAPGSKDPRNDDDAQSSYCVAPVETSSRFDRFTATLSKTAESVQGDGEESETSATAPVPPLPPPPPPTPAVVGAGFGDDPQTTAPADAIVTSSGSGGRTVTETPLAAGSAPAGNSVAAVTGEGGRGGSIEAVTAEGGPGGEGTGEGVGEGGGEGLEGGAGRKLSGREWLRTHPHGTPPTMKLAMQFDQVLTQRVLAFHSEWLRENLLSRARAVWLYTLLACLEKPLGSETAALVREVLRRCCAQRAEVESPQDENLPALNVIVAITGKFFQQAEAP